MNDEVQHFQELQQLNGDDQMKVGIIGLGRMGEGMSRRLMKWSIETYGYRRNYEKHKRPLEKGYIDHAALDIEHLVQQVKRDGPSHL